jgi:hypothetical protein
MKGQESGAAMGWAHGVGEGSPFTPWPTRAGGVVIIPWCYQHPGMKQFVLSGAPNHQTAGDLHVFFNCKAVNAYDHAASLAAPHDPPQSMDEVCKSTLLGRQFGFPTYDWTTENPKSDHFDTTDPNQEYRTSSYSTSRSQNYDLRSVMHYTSWHDGKDTGHTMDEMPLVAWKQKYTKIEDVPHQATEENAERNFLNSMPSPMDIQAIKQLYPHS